jgi:hypothetical protein
VEAVKLPSVSMVNTSGTMIGDMIFML